jgi:hypothetical protein
LHFVDWVEPVPSFVGVRCTQPNLHFAVVIAKCETQQRPISKPSPKVSFLIRLAVFSGQRRRSYETTPKWHGFFLIRLAAAMAWIKQQTAEYRISNNEFRRMESLRSISLLKKIEYIPSTFDIRYSLFDIRFFRVSFSI